MTHYKYYERNRIKAFAFSFEFIKDISTTGLHIDGCYVENGIPEDAEIVGAHINRACLVLFVYHPSFPELMGDDEPTLAIPATYIKVVKPEVKE